MAVFLDLDDDDSHDDPHAGLRNGFPPRKPNPLDPTTRHTEQHQVIHSAGTERPNPNLNAVSAALACYPIIVQITRSIDPNTLHALALTCRQIRANILPFRSGLAQQTLRCTNDDRDASRPYARMGACARDLVSECRRCGSVICRNCAHKPPPPTALPSRLRRLCPSCLSAPLAHLTARRNACACPSAIHLCLPCGLPRSANDTTYARVRAWRTRYAATGIGEGDEGARCWRGEACLGAEAREVEVEVEDGGSGTGAGSGEGGYAKQEVVGVGGVVKRKGRRRIRVGGRLVGTEEMGERSWCGWCERVVAGATE